MNKIILAGLGVGLLIGLAGSANATSTGFQFSGSWTNVDSSLVDWFTEGDSFQAIVRYDAASSPYYSGSSNGASLSKYSNNYVNFSTGDWQATDPDAEIKVYNDYNESDQLVIWFNPTDVGNLQFPVGMPEFNNGFINFTDNDYDTFADSSLPEDIELLSSLPFESSLFVLNFEIDGVNQCVSGNIGNISLLPVPEPGTCLLLATGLIALAAFRHRKPISSKL